jgi:Tfp pilus assembly protein PilF
MYNFFGYIENYALFILTSLLYCMTGLLVSLGRAPRWTLLPLLGLTVLSHVFGVVFLPSTIYLILTGTGIGARVGRWTSITKLLLSAVLAVIGLATFFHFYSNYYYFRFAIVPLLPDRFTVEGYHLFSVPHLLDMVNLALLLAPALPVVIAIVLVMPLKSMFRRSEYRYLAILVLSCWAAMFIFDPKLGMPRDWDLFSFAGVPLALLSFYLVLDKKVRPPNHAPIALMMILLGLLVLFPRAISQTNPDQSVKWFNNYAALDKTKNMYGRTLLKKYYDRRGDAVTAEQEYRLYVTDYPQFVLNREGIALKKEGKLEEAIAKFREALNLHPTFVAPYANMGMCYLNLGRFDSAAVMLRIAVGMNPYNFVVHNTLARTYYEQGNYAKAEEMLRRAHKLSPSELQPLVGLVQLYKKINDLDNWLEFLSELVAHDNAPLTALTELATYHLNHRQFVAAAPLYRRAAAQGLDSTYINRLRRDYPQLGL